MQSTIKELIPAKFPANIWIKFIKGLTFISLLFLLLSCGVEPSGKDIDGGADTPLFDGGINQDLFPNDNQSSSFENNSNSENIIGDQINSLDGGDLTVDEEENTDPILQSPCQEDYITKGACKEGDRVIACVKGKYTQTYCRTWTLTGPKIYAPCEGKTDLSLKDCLYNLVKSHSALGYETAKDKLFSTISNDNGYVECVYTGRRIKTRNKPNNTDMNCEHTWPKSRGAGSGAAKADLHHLFPTDSNTNSRRSSLEFGVVDQNNWSEGGSKRGICQPSGTYCFEPRDQHKGDAARAIFYMAIRYKLYINQNEEMHLQKWNQQDPPDQWEKDRHERIVKYQKKRNPFIDVPDLAAYIRDF